ncbi:type VII secretion protein EccCa [Mycobacteroides abscessus]|uniref:type VII secretion protein EccCa n=1 Tax=Mycobacteroides abscessus TaxID=36809 RepID=UPI001878B388
MSTEPWIPPRRRVDAPDSKEVSVETEVPPPPEIKEVVPPSKWQRLLPILMVVAIVGMIGIFLASGIRKITSPTMLLFPIMFAVSALGMMGGYGNSGGPKTAEINALRRKYLEMLSNLRTKVYSRAAAQYDYLSHFAPPPSALAAMVGGPRTWERSRPAKDPTYFLAVRAGVARQRLGGGMKMVDAPPDNVIEPVSRVFAERFFRAHRAVEGMPTIIDLKTHRSVQFFGTGDVLGVIRSMLLQLAVFHPPNLVLIAVVTDDPEQWDWIKWLPHNQNPHRRDAMGTERMVYTPADGPAALEKILAGRGDFSADEAFTGNKPWLIVVADRIERGIAGCGEGMEAVTVLRRGGEDEDGLEVMGARVEIAPDGRARKRKMTADDPLANWLSAVDSVGIAQARQIARRMARWRAVTDKQAVSGRTSDSSKTVQSWASLHGVVDLGVMGNSLWRHHPEGDRGRMRTAIGWDKTGAPVEVDIKEEAEQGMGSHGLILGYTGSGKSTFLVNLLLGLVALHTPEELNLILIDYKGESTFDGFEKLKHTVEIISNLSSQDMIDRLSAVLRGEVERRQRLRSEMGMATTGKKFRDARTYLKARERGANIPPFPTLLVVTDEFTALLKDHPEFRDDYEHLARQGRADRICLMLATQSLTGVSVGQLLSNCGWKIAMKTASGQESQAVIEDKAAYYLTEPGEGYLKVGGAEPRYFRAANPTELYFPPDEQTVGRGERSAVGGITGVAPFTVTAVPIPGQDDTDDEVEAAPVQRTAEELDNAPEVGSVILNQLAGHGTDCLKLWLPPLLKPRPVGRLVADSGLHAGDRAVLTLPIGLLDVPYKHAQQVFTVDLAENNLAMLGRTRSGKSVAMQTLAIAAAKLNSPRRLQIYGLDFSSDSKLLALEGLPHVGGVALRRDNDAVSRVLAEVTEVIEKRSELFRTLRVTGMASYRDKVAQGTAPDDGFGDVLLLVDGFDAFKEDHDDLVPVLAEITNSGLAVGVHVVVAVQVFSTLGRSLNQSFSARIDFKLNSPELSGVNDKKLAESIPADVPGRALDLASHLHLMIGAPRLDEIEAVDDAGLAAAIADISATWQGEGARQVRVLPERVEASQLHVPADWTGSKWTVPIGLYEKDLSPVLFDFMSGRHLNIFGGPKCGKTHLIASMMTSLTSRFTPDEVRFFVVDLKGSELLDAIDEDYLVRWDAIEEVPNPQYKAGDFKAPPKIKKTVPRSSLVTSPTDLAPVMMGVAGSMENRRLKGTETIQERRARSWWSGPEIFLFVDDYSAVANAAPSGFAPLAEHWGNAPMMGIHSVVACPMVTANRMLGSGNSLPKLNNEAGGSNLIMDGLRSEGPVLTVRLDRKPKGRGILLSSEGQEVIQTPVVPELEKALPGAGSS